MTLESLDLSPQFYFMRSYNGLKSPAGLALVVLLTLIMFAYLGRRVRGGIMLAAMLAAFPVLFGVSRAAARHELLLRFCRPSGRIQFALRDDLLKDAAATPADHDPSAKPNAAAKSAARKSAATAAAPRTEAAMAGAHPPQNAAALPSDAKTPQALQALSEAGRVALLLETKDRIIVFAIPNCYPLGPKGPKMVPAEHVYTLLRSDLKFTNVTP
ncbi:MAG: hypothetical protein WA294_00860 [Acidobacteriaceae bacterium]